MTRAPERDEAGSDSRERLRHERARHFRRALGLTALGTLLPGAGLTQTRGRRLGWVLFGITVAALVAVTWSLLSRGVVRSGLALVGRPNLLRLLAIGFLIGGLIWCVSIVLTALLTRPERLDRTRTRVLAGFTTAMVLLAGGLSYKAAEYTAITQDTIQAVFTPGSDTGPALAQGEDPWADTPRVNVLLLGSDAGVDRTGTRTDSMVVASINTKTGATVLISLPRNLEDVPIPRTSPLRQLYPSGVYGRPVCLRQQADPTDACLLNAVWTEADQWAADHPGSFAGEASPGRSTTRAVIAEALGITINHTVVIDLKGFIRLVDAMGGVDLNVGTSATGAKLPIGGELTASGQLVGVKGYFEPGRQHLDGWHTLWYARTRAADDDYHRMARQRCVIKAVIDQVNPAAMLGKYAEIARIAQQNIYTDIPGGNLEAYVTLVERIQGATISSVPLDPAHGIDPADPDFTAIRAAVKRALNPPAPKPSTPGGTATSTPPTSTSTPAPSTTTSTADQC